MSSFKEIFQKIKSYSNIKNIKHWIYVLSLNSHRKLFFFLKLNYNVFSTVNLNYLYSNIL